MPGPARLRAHGPTSKPDQSPIPNYDGYLARVVSVCLINAWGLETYGQWKALTYRFLFMLQDVGLKTSAFRTLNPECTNRQESVCHVTEAMMSMTRPSHNILQIVEIDVQTITYLAWIEFCTGTACMHTIDSPWLVILSESNPSVRLAGGRVLDILSVYQPSDQHCSLSIHPCRSQGWKSRRRGFFFCCRLQ